MEILISGSAETASLAAAKKIARLVHQKPNAVLGLATGSTPLMLYRELIRLHRNEGLDFSKVRTFNLDEYLGLGSDHPASYQQFMREHFLDPVQLPPAQSHIPDGMALDIPATCAAYEAKIREAGGIDMQILGIGSDGHIGFNEPGSSLASRTRIKTLTRRTRQDNARFFSSIDEVPHHVITMGIGTIMEARCLVLMGFGEQKAQALAGAIEGPITASNPASILQMHPAVHVFIDDEASKFLTRSEYYRWVDAQKPAWQRD